MTSLVERIKHRRRNPTDKLLDEAARELIRLELMVGRRNGMLQEILDATNVVLPVDMRSRAVGMALDEEI